MEKYKRLLRYYGITQAEAAKRCGYTSGTMSAWLNGYGAMPSGVEYQIQEIIAEAKAADTENYLQLAAS